MKIIKELALLLILIAFSRIYDTTGQIITKNLFKKDIHTIKEILNESALKHKKDYSVNNEKKYTFSKIKEKRNLILLNEPSNLNFFLEINQLKNNYDTNIPVCIIKNCFMPHGVCVGDSFCKCSKNFGNLLMIDLIERIRINNNENFISKLMSHNDIAYFFAEYFRKFYSESFCGYHKKSQLITFLLESIFLIGIGHFYSNRFFHGLLKFLLIALIILLVSSMKKSKIEIKFFMNVISDKLSFDYLYNFLFFILFVNFIFVHIVDVIMIASNQYLDGFGFPMISWNSRFYDH